MYKKSLNKKSLWGLLVLLALFLFPLSSEAKESVKKSGTEEKEETTFSYAKNSLKPLVVNSESKLRISTQNYGTYMSKGDSVLADKGFFPFMIQVENLSNSPRSLELSFIQGYTETPFYRQFLEVPAGESLRSLIFVPFYLTSQNDSSTMTLKIWDTNAGLLCAEDRLSRTYRSSSRCMNVGITPGMLRTKLPEIDNLCLMEFTPMDTPADVRFYASMDGFLLTQEDWDMMDASHKGAVLDWVNSGGILMINNLEEKKNRTSAYGLGEIRTSSVDSSSGAKVAALLKNFVSFENIFRLRLDAASQSFSFEDKNDSAELPSGTGLFLLIFVIIVGPINLWVFAPKNRRHKLFATVPLISLSGSLILCCYILLVDGFGGKGDREVLVVLSSDSPSAFVSQSQVSRSGILTSSDIPMDEYTLMEAYQRPPKKRYGHKSSEIWEFKSNTFRTDGVAQGFFASRSNFKHNLARYVPTRAKVSLVSKTGEPPVIQTTLSTPLTDFVYRDASGLLWEAAKVPPGTKVTLSPKTGKSAVKVKDGNFHAIGTAGDLAPIETHPSIKWQDHIVYVGRVHVS